MELQVLLEEKAELEEARDISDTFSHHLKRR